MPSFHFANTPIVSVPFESQSPTTGLFPLAPQANQPMSMGPAVFEFLSAQLPDENTPRSCRYRWHPSRRQAVSVRHPPRQTRHRPRRSSGLLHQVLRPRRAGQRLSHARQPAARQPSRIERPARYDVVAAHLEHAPGLGFQGTVTAPSPGRPQACVHLATSLPREYDTIVGCRTIVIN